MSRRKTSKGKPKQRSGGQTTKSKTRRMDGDVENPNYDLKHQKTKWWSYIRHPSMIIDAITSGIIWIQVLVYQKFAGRMPLFIKSKSDDQEQQVMKYITRISELEGDLGTFKEKNESLSDENSTVKETIETLREKIAEIEKDKGCLQEKNERIEKEKSTFQTANMELNNTNSDLKKEIISLKKERQNFTVETENREKEFQKLLNELKSLENSLAIKTDEKRQLEIEITSLQTENKTQLKLNDELKERNSHMIKIHEKANKDIEDLNQRIYHYQVEKRDNETTIQELHRNINTLAGEKSILEGEKQEALRRLSEQVSVKLRDNNPNIVDLSDPCRATKLAEMFGELYDNEWTNAFSALDETFTEEQAIVLLLDTVMLAYSLCEKRVYKPWKTLEDWFLDTNLPGNQQTSKWLKDSRKVNIKKKVPEIVNIFTKCMLRACGEDKLKTLVSTDKDMEAYFTKCIEVCLLMVTTDPPIVLVCPGWNVIHFDSLQSNVQYEGRRDERNDDSRPKEKLGDIKQDAAEEKSKLSKDNTDIEEKTATKLISEVNLKNDSNNTEDDEAQCQQENQVQCVSVPQSLDDTNTYTQNSMPCDDLKALIGNSEEIENGESVSDSDKSNNAFPEETQNVEDNRTVTMGTHDKTVISKEDDKTERDEHNLPQKHEECISNQEAKCINIDNSNAFDSDDSSLPQKEEPDQCNQTTDNATEKEHSRNTTTSNINEQQSEEKMFEAKKERMEIEEKENGKNGENKSQSGDQQGDNDGQRTYVTETCISQDKTSNDLHDKSNDGEKKETNVENLKFSKELFKEYTCRGEYQDYVVWPAMRLHENGPLLSKGVAQGCKNKTKVNNDNVWSWVHR